jgi:hypothetical protein
MMTPDPDTLHAIADWVRVTEAHVISITCYEAPVSVLVDAASFRRAMAGAVVTIEHHWGRGADDHLTSPDLGGWHVCAIERVGCAAGRIEQVAL